MTILFDNGTYKGVEVGEDYMAVSAGHRVYVTLTTELGEIGFHLKQFPEQLEFLRKDGKFSALVILERFNKNSEYQFIPEKGQILIVKGGKYYWGINDFRTEKRYYTLSQASDIRNYVTVHDIYADSDIDADELKVMQTNLDAIYADSKDRLAIVSANLESIRLQAEKAPKLPDPPVYKQDNIGTYLKEINAAIAEIETPQAA